MAIAATNLVYIGAPGNAGAQGQVIAANDSGPAGQQQFGIGTATLDGAATTFTLNWIDGVQKPYARTTIVPVSTVTAPATINGVANQAQYGGVAAFGQFRVGQSVLFAGFTNAGNNGTFAITAIGTGFLQVTNASSVLETNPAGTASVTTGPGVAVAYGNRAMESAAGVVDTAANSITATLSAFTQTGCTVTLSGAGSNGQLLSVFAGLIPSNASY